MEQESGIIIDPSVFEQAEETKDAHIVTATSHAISMSASIRRLANSKLSNYQIQKVIAIRDHLGEEFQKFVDSLHRS